MGTLRSLLSLTTTTTTTTTKITTTTPKRVHCGCIRYKTIKERTQIKRVNNKFFLKPFQILYNTTYVMPPASLIARVLQLQCAPAPFQSPSMGLGSSVALTPKSSATLYKRYLANHRWSPMSIPSHGPTWNSHWKEKNTIYECVYFQKHVTIYRIRKRTSTCPYYIISICICQETSNCSLYLVTTYASIYFQNHVTIYRNTERERLIVHYIQLQLTHVSTFRIMLQLTHVSIFRIMLLFIETDGENVLLFIIFSYNLRMYLFLESCYYLQKQMERTSNCSLYLVTTYACIYFQKHATIQNNKQEYAVFCFVIYLWQETCKWIQKHKEATLLVYYNVSYTVSITVSLFLS